MSSEYDRDEQVPPQWLNTGFFERVFQPKNNGEKMQIINIKVQPATKKGEHYASVMFRVKATFTFAADCAAAQRPQSKSFIVKALPELEGEKQRLLEGSKLFETEIGIYTDVLPKLVEVLRLAGERIRFGAHCLHHALTPIKVLVFEDLTEIGYEMVRGRTLTLKEIKAGYRKLAKWHAASYKLANDAMQPGWATKCRATYTEYFYNPQPHTWYGVCHGDVLANNLMFRHVPLTGELDDVLLVDYQLAYMGPLVNDVIYSYYMLYTPEQRAENYEELFEHYFRHFVQTLEMLGYQTEALTFECFQQQLKRQKVLALFLLVSFLPIRHALLAGLIDRDHLMATDDERRDLYYDKNYIAELHSILPMYLKLGYLE
ncbi:uncharacterized protein LOC128921894 isoform X2 [Zeugodacus cucurbitae]|uniref:uncharacterized protein LOC128921894 isoform X2 n=1 Tax=Zeugodacus cucurbitae TaxID=28588 RepID=UPI0023D93040|nr:uncharacterized protein LOC128921894 isoform X2 [Zeugodacus cucurbitae]